MDCKVYLINLERSTERLAASQNELVQAGIAYERVSAIDGTNISDAEAGIKLSSDYSKYHKKLSHMEMACYLSHIKCWEQLLSSNKRFAIVLEDDFTIVGDFHQTITELTSIENEWDCIKLVEYPLKRKALLKIPLHTHDLVVYDKIPSRTGAYAISREGAQKMLAHSQKIGRPVDIEFQYWWEKQLKVFGLTPYSLSVRGNTPSTIDISNEDRKQSTNRLFVKAKQLVYYKMANYWHTRSWIRKLKQHDNH